MTRKTIFILNHFAYAPDQLAGTRHYKLAKFLVSRGFIVRIVSSGFFHKQRKHRHSLRKGLFFEEGIAGVTYVWIWSPPYSKNDWMRVLNFLYFAAISYVYLLINIRSDSILYCSSPQPFSAYLSLELIPKCSKKIFEIRDLWPQVLIDMNELSPKSLTSRFLYCMEKRSIYNADLLVSNLPYLQKYLDSRKILPPNLLTLPNGISVNELSLMQSASPALVKSTRLIVLYAGAHGSAQNLFNVCAAASFLAPSGHFEFHFLGDGMLLDTLASRYESSNIRFHGPVSKNKLYQFYKSADFLLLPLVDADAFQFGISPNKLSEYLAASKPILFFGPKGVSPLTHKVNALCSNGTAVMDLVDLLNLALSVDVDEYQTLRRNAEILLKSSYLDEVAWSRLLFQLEVS
jgi:glycosyltransferase involved in cell wall biosynthesis